MKSVLHAGATRYTEAVIPVRALLFASAGWLAACGAHPDRTASDASLDATQRDDDAQDDPDDDAQEDDPDADRAQDAGPEVFDAGSQVPEHCGFSDGKLDLLLLVDNSGSMATEQDLLARELPKMIRALASGDVDADGKQDHPKADLHVGVISTDMGLSGLDVYIQQCSRLGDDGLLRTPPACAPAPSGFLEHATDAGQSVDSFGDAVGCLTKLGAKGCGMEQHLEAVLKALTPASDPLRFAFDTAGHGDGANQGFLRPDSVLAVIVVSDEDDCSFDGTSRALIEAADAGMHVGPAASLNYRCQAEPERLYPVARYVDQLRALRRDAPGSLFFAVIAGVPTELAARAANVTEMLADPRMKFQPRTDQMGDRVSPVPACTALRSNSAGGSESVEATPARRLLEVAESFGEHAVIGSICEPDFTRSVASIAKRIGGVLACPEAPILF